MELLSDPAVALEELAGLVLVEPLDVPAASVVAVAVSGEVSLPLLLGPDVAPPVPSAAAGSDSSPQPTIENSPSRPMVSTVGRALIG